MRAKAPTSGRRDLSGSQAAQLLRDGRLGEVLIARAEAQSRSHSAALGDQADALRRAVCAQQTRDGAAA